MLSGQSASAFAMMLEKNSDCTASQNCSTAIIACPSSIESSKYRFQNSSVSPSEI